MRLVGYQGEVMEVSVQPTNSMLPVLNILGRAYLHDTPASEPEPCYFLLEYDSTKTSPQSLSTKPTGAPPVLFIHPDKVKLSTVVVEIEVRATESMLREGEI